MKELEYPFDSSLIIRKKKKYKRLLLEQLDEPVKLKIAILAGSTVIDIKFILELFLLNENIEPEIYVTEYGQFFNEVIYNDEKLNEFNPDIVYIHTTFRNISVKLKINDSKEAIDLKLQKLYEEYETIWKNIKQKWGSIIIQNNFERPLYQLLGNKDISSYNGMGNFVHRLNSKFYEYSNENSNMYINDIDYLSAEYGINKWHNNKHWYEYKYAMDINAIPKLCYNIFAIIKSLYGKNKRGIILDADNTLWGGVVGEDGSNNLLIGTDTAKGYSFFEWQEFLKKLSEIGIILTVVSKNNEKDLIEGINNTDNILKNTDFANIIGNWERKDINIKNLTNELDLLEKHFLFVDDNATERELINNSNLNIKVLDANKPEEFMNLINNGRYFEVTKLTDADFERKQQYEVRKKRESENQKFINYEDFLKSLSMKARIKIYRESDTERIVQLINKSNQFNLTTKRYNKEDFIKEMQNKICFYSRLSDKFGDYGIVCIAICNIENEIMNIENLLMSCRVLNKNMEYALMDFIIEYATENNIKYIMGSYIPSKKNMQVSKLYNKFGFKEIRENIWNIEIKKYKKLNNIIERNKYVRED